MDYRIFPPDEIIETAVELPQSKSVNARALILNYISGNKDARSGCEDTDTLAAVLAGGLRRDGGVTDLGAAGTSIRFMTALCAASEGTDCILTGTARLCERPVSPLVKALRTLGADIEYTSKEGFPPLHIRGRKLSGGSIDIDASESSQYVSALMMISPLLDKALTIRLLGNVQSMPYIELTAEMMRRCGADVDLDRDKIDISAGQQLHGCSTAEADWSAAAFWYEIAAVSAGWITLKGLRADSLQGDRRVAELFSRLGVVTEPSEDGSGIDLSANPDLYGKLEEDLTDMPDAVPALVATCCLVGIPFRLSGVGALHHKESDRIAALTAEMARIGCILETEAYGTVLCWDGRRVPVQTLPEFDTHNDHRIAMALAAVAVYIPGIVIRDAEVVCKSYPGFWDQLRQAGFKLVDPAEPLPAEE